jgi:glycosyltransferase involved in cell wall biosynthesis
MSALSVVIITRNEEHNIVGCIQSAKQISDDIIVVDACSNDQTVALAIESGAKVFSVNWKGYGASRNFGALKAQNDWILALDADERISNTLHTSIRRLKFTDTNCIYRFRRKNFVGDKEMSFGTLGFETVKRIYNRKYAQWDLTLVHEKLVAPTAVLYAQMSAKKYFLDGRKINLLKLLASPVFNSVKSYIFQLGFLDGRTGWISAKTIASYSWLKYFYLHRLWKQSKTKAINLSLNPKVERA